MAQFNKKLITLSSLLLAGSVNAGEPGFNNINIDVDGDLVINLNADTTPIFDNINVDGDLVIILDADTTPIVEGAGFLQQEVTLGTEAYIQTVIIDPLTTNPANNIDLSTLAFSDLTFVQMAGSANGITSLRLITPPPEQNNIMVTWIGQRVVPGQSGSSIFGFQSVNDINDAEDAISTFSTDTVEFPTASPFAWDTTNFGEPPTLGSAPPPAPYLVLDRPVVTITAEGPVTHIDSALLGGYKVYHQNGAGNIEILLSEEASSETGSFGSFLPGAHYLSWVVPAQSGLSAALFATQALHVQPLISFGPATVIPAGKGSTVTLPLFLNGKAATYPVTVEYSISGNANYPEDHNATNGIVTINSAHKGSITVNIASDSTANEINEEIIFTLHSPQNAGLGKQLSQRVLITAAHLPPQLDLLVLQQDKETRHVHHNEDSANVIAVIDINANNASSRYRLDWGDTDNLLLSQSTASGFTLQFDPNDVPPGRYQISVEISDLNDSENRQYNITKLINVIGSQTAAAQPLPSTGLSQPVYVHSMQHGASINWPHSDSDMEGFPLSAHVYEESLLWPAGLKVTSGDTSTAIKKTGHYITADDLASHGGPNGEAALYATDAGQLPRQIVDFEISGLTTPGQSVSIVIPQESPIPENPVYRKYMSHTGWMTFTEDAKNSLASTIKINGICPAPNDAAYTAGLTTGDNCIQLTIEDGGPNDADQQANSLIKDPGGVTSEITATTSVSANADSNSGGGGAALSLLWLLLTLAAAHVYRKIINTK